METFPRPRHDGGMTETIDAATIPARLRDGFRRFYTRAHARRGVILGTHYLEGKKAPYLTREIPRKVDALPIWAELRADGIQTRAELLYLEREWKEIPNPETGELETCLVPTGKATRGRAWAHAVSGWRFTRQDMDCGGKGKSRQPLPLELDVEGRFAGSIGARPDRVRVPSEMPDPAYMDAGAATPLIRAERIRSAEAARAAILRAAERTEGGQSAARILLGGSSCRKEAAARDVSRRKVANDLDIVSRIAATAALEANA